MPCVVQDWRTRRGADARLHERRGARAHARRRASCTCTAARAKRLGTRAKPAATSRPSGRCGWTATATRCWRWSSPPAQPATRASAPAFTAASSSRPRRTRRCRRLSARCARARAERPQGSYTVTLLDDPALAGAKVLRGGRGGRARRARGVRRARRRRGRRPALPPARADARPRTGARRRRAGARWPPRCARPSALERGHAAPEASRAPASSPANYNLIPLRHSFIDDCETPVSAFLKLRALAPASRRSCSSPPTRASASGAGRSSAYRPRCGPALVARRRRRPVRARGRARRPLSPGAHARGRPAVHRRRGGLLRL